MEFDVKNYLPVLRFKKAEIKAFNKLNLNQRKNITPIFELVPRKKPDTIIDDFRSRLKNLTPYFIDFKKFVNNDTDINIMIKIINSLYAFGQNPIICIDIEAKKKELEQINKILKKRNIKEISIRCNSILLNSPIFERNCNDIINYLGLKFDSVHLLIDHGSIFEDINTIQSIKQLNKFIPKLEYWKTFSLLAGAFPKDLSELEKNDIHYLPRKEWQNYKYQIDNSLVRIPNFGDYTIQYGDYMLPAGFNVSASIRYTLEYEWKVMRGESIKTGGSIQYQAQSQILIDDVNEYYGKNYSFGDEYIYQISQANNNYGNAQSWLTAGINHHIVLTSNQINELF